VVRVREDSHTPLARRRAARSWRASHHRSRDVQIAGDLALVWRIVNSITIAREAR